MSAPVLPGGEGSHFKESGKMIVLRIRIQSPALLRILCRIITEGEQSWTTKPRTFIRPFGPLIYYFKEVRKHLTWLKERWGTPDHVPDHLDPGAGTPSSVAGSEHDSSSRSVEDCPAALADLSAYCEFMENEVMHYYTKFDNLKASANDSPVKIRFHDLWYLFRVGELIFRPVGNGATKDLNNTALGNRTWRCYGTRPFWSQYRFAKDESRSYTGEDESERESFGVHCYYIDYTGEEFCVVTDTFEIRPFKGERPIKSLRVFPYRFASNHKDLQEAALDNGKRFLRSIKSRHSAYQGWSTTMTPRGTLSTDAEGRALTRPEYVDSEVIVDFVEAFQTCPSWKPEATVIRNEEANPYQVDDDIRIFWWSDKDRTTKLPREDGEVLILRTGVTAYERNFNLYADNPHADQFLVKIRENDRNGGKTTEEHLNQDVTDPKCDLLLLPSRIFAYVLRDRKFLQLVVQSLNEVKKSTDAFGFLKINKRHKAVIQSLVEDHFDRKSSDRQGGIDINSIDLIRGKGKGLFILLHGVPGVGKTATAEAIAAANGKPLFPITCGDLGLTPSEVETALQRIFRLADTWNCVLLLDEVDTFFSTRQKGDTALAKNAVVSVFLRILEYYDGLLFMTTNRPGALDEAFKSRIHLKLFYPHLTREQTNEIWAMNIDRLEKIEAERVKRSRADLPLRIAREDILNFAEDMFEDQVRKDSRGTRWNGRQIRNAFQVASSLAHYEARQGGKPPKLTKKHFKTIHHVTEDFDQFMIETIGKTDSEMAKDKAERADDFISKQKRRDYEDDEDEDEETDHRERRARRGSDSYGEGYGGGEGPSRRRRRSSVDGIRRSVSPNVAALQERARGSNSIFKAPPSPQHRAHHHHVGGRKPSIEVTSDTNDTYLLPEAARSSDAWDRPPSRSGKRYRRDRSADTERSERPKKRRQKSDSDEEDDDASG